jgi:hypothetical protein
MFLVNVYDKSATDGHFDDANYRWLKTLYHSPLDNFREDVHYQAGVTYGQINFLIGYIAANRKDKIRWHFDF